MGDMAVAGFVLGLVGLIFGIIGMTLGIVGTAIALKAVRTMRQLAGRIERAERPALGSPGQWPAIEPQRYADGTAELPLDLHHELRALRDNGQPILAVKRVREATGLDLAQAKRLVDRL